MSNKMQNDSHEKTASARRLILVSIGLVIFLIMVFYFWQAKQNNSDNKQFGETQNCETNPELKTSKVASGEVEVGVEIVNSYKDMQKGLSDRNCLEESRGMLFAYSEEGNNCFWMKDMKFSIDMIWLDKDKKVVHIKQNASPQTYPNTFCSEKPAQYVLEVNSGVSAKNDWQLGSQFDF